MLCKKPIRIFNKRNLISGMLVPCGSCVLCRKARAKEWSLRLYHELEEYKNDSSFVTLTYRDDCVPDFGSLRKQDLQKFFKRLRKSINIRATENGLQNKKLRYFACGEYGDRTQRPHYHVLLFGCGLDYDDRKLVMDNWYYADWNVRDIREKSFAPVTEASIRYVAQYINKKFTGIKEFEEYVSTNREPVFKVSSLGIGRNWCDSNIERISNDEFISTNGVKCSIPRYYIKRHKLELSGKYAKEKEIELVKSLTGEDNVTRELAYLMSLDIVEDKIIASCEQAEINELSKLNLKVRKL